MDERTLDQLELLAKVLLYGAALVIALSVIGAGAVATSETSVPGFDEVQRANRGLLAVGAFAAGLVASGVLAGLGAILRVMVADRRERQPPPATPSGGPQAGA